ncbi:phage antirepressor N-terminal domain-containing protein [Mycolicibacterium canariasense]|uniref:phage antirepressor N-terminal domain-containing protein n=1 Tax=Mycolicibacterium canariasense TaxID=228230 RepID=UPI0032D5817D
MTTELVRVPVPGAADLMATQFDGHEWAALKPMCDSLGIDTWTQQRKLNSKSWATTSIMTVVAGDGKPREMAMIDSRSIPMWLATIDENRVAEEARPALIALQREARDALDAYFNKRAVTAPGVNQFDVLRAAIDQIEAAQREASEARAVAERTEARLDAIEGKHDWFSAIAYARLHDLPTNTKFLQKLGGCAGRIGRSHGVEPTQVQHQLYGWVNSWPAWVWDLAADGFSA